MCGQQTGTYSITVKKWSLVKELSGTLTFRVRSPGGSVVSNAVSITYVADC